MEQGPDEAFFVEPFLRGQVESVDLIQRLIGRIVNHPLDPGGRRQAPLGNYGRTEGPDASQPIDCGLVLELEDLDILRLNPLWLE